MNCLPTYLRTLLIGSADVTKRARRLNIDITVWAGKRQSRLLTGKPAVHGDDAVAALDKELVELYRARPELGSECSDSDRTGIRKKQNGQHEQLSTNKCGFLFMVYTYIFLVRCPTRHHSIHFPATKTTTHRAQSVTIILASELVFVFVGQLFLWLTVPFHALTLAP